MCWVGSCGRLRLSLPLAANSITPEQYVRWQPVLRRGCCRLEKLVALGLREAGVTDGHIVIQQAQIDYAEPVLSDALAVCAAPVAPGGTGFLALYQRRGPEARLKLHSRILVSDIRRALSPDATYCTA